MVATADDRDAAEGSDAPGAGREPRGSDKAPGAFRTISEVAEDIDVPQHVLRFWETRFAQIRPLKRAGGRRYYRADDVALLRGIRHLLYGQGYTIRGVQRILKAEGVRLVQAVGRGEAEAASFVPAPGDEEPGPEPAPTPDDAPAPPGLAPAARARLGAVLDDLRECARILTAARDAAAED